MRETTVQLYYRVDRRRINLIRFTFEAYEGLGVISTLDAELGRVVLSVAPGCESTARAVMDDLGRLFLIEACDAPEQRFSFR